MRHATLCILVLLAACGGDDEAARSEEGGDAPAEAADVVNDEADEAQPDDAADDAPEADEPEDGYTATAKARDGVGAGRRSVVQCAAGVPAGVGSPISPQWVAYSDRDHAELDPLPKDCRIGDSDVTLEKVLMAEDETGRTRCGVNMQGSVTSTYHYGYAGASATVVEKTLQDFETIELQTKGDGRLYRLEFLMDEQLRLQCGDKGLNPYGVVFRCGTGNAERVITHTISLDGLTQELAEGGSPWGDVIPWDASEVRRVQIRPMNSGGNQFGFDCSFRMHWLQPKPTVRSLD